MPRKRIGLELPTGGAKQELAKQLAAELNSDRPYGLPFIYEQEYRSGKLLILVVWDDWAPLPLQERSATILRAYELAEGPAYVDRIALTSGLTVPEALGAGMLPYHIIPALRRGDPVTADDVRQALLAEGGTRLVSPGRVQLRLATHEEAEAARQRLIEKFPGSEEIWLIERDSTGPESISGADGEGHDES
jgi:hypothetical protein